jgi:hypothetical protein
VAAIFASRPAEAWWVALLFLVCAGILVGLGYSTLGSATTTVAIVATPIGIVGVAFAVTALLFELE